MFKKKNNKNQILVILSLFFLIQSSLILANYNFFLGSGESTLQHGDKPNLQIKASSLNPLDPFIIDDFGAGDFTWAQAAAQPWCSGNGSINNPYLIEKIVINGKNSSSCLIIRNSLTAHFIIRDSLFYNSSRNLAVRDAGIYLYSTKNGVLENNTCINNQGNGIYLFNSDFTILSLNNASNNDHRGLYLDQNSNNNTVQNNYVMYNKLTGIQLYSSYENIVEGNIVQENDGDGIFLQFSDSSEIISNTVYKSGARGIVNYQNSDNNKYYYNNVTDSTSHGFQIFLCENITLLGNDIYENVNGLNLAQSENLKILSNSIVENIVGILGMTFLDSIQFYNNTISYSSGDGIYISKMNHSSFENNYIYRNGVGILENGLYLYNCEYGIIHNNSILENGGDGITLTYSSSFYVSKNEIIDNGEHGIYLYGSQSGGSSNNNTINKNKILGNQKNGIYIWNTDFVPSDCNITNNIVQKNHETGIYIDWSDDNLIKNNTIEHNFDYGLRLLSLTNSKILNNHIQNHTQDGIELWNSSNNLVDSNIVKESTHEGIELNYNCERNKLTQNSILDNNVGIYLYNNCDNNTFFENIIEGSNNDGIQIASIPSTCDDNLFYENYFRLNSHHIHDYSGTNIWNNSMIGNYWDDYSGVDDSPEDGIGDSPYSFTGGTDYLPIWDDDNPVIFISLPGNNSRQPNQAPYFNVIGEDLNLDSIWYTLDNGLTNITINSNGSIDQSYWLSIWNVLSDGQYIELTFYANDTFGHIGYNKTFLVKDDFPEVNLISPLNGTQVQRKSLDFVFEVFDFSRDDMWYTIDGNPTKYFFSSNGSIESTAFFAVWDSKSDGESIIVEFFANDTHGQVSSDSITLIKKIPPPPSGIPGYNLIFILVSITATISIIYNISTKRKKI
ncbi:MAG: hypothetical protein GF317_02945 [Candidatus Lokiarchaeota archaeon]|nr:hypothetical protein [Candidatus Lokiarchaeota archaeon]MBD3198864.1 hypothetical protein [Candidatus Lokiarchaeota archaeon]